MLTFNLTLKYFLTWHRMSSCPSIYFSFFFSFSIFWVGFHLHKTNESHILTFWTTKIHVIMIIVNRANKRLSQACSFYRCSVKVNFWLGNIDIDTWLMTDKLRYIAAKPPSAQNELFILWCLYSTCEDIINLFKMNSYVIKLCNVTITNCKSMWKERLHH